MTTELEQEFYDTFGIEKQCICPYFPEYKENGCKVCVKYFQGKKDCSKKNQYKYPSITAKKLLEMICILNSIYDCGFKNNTSLASKEVKYLKMEILKYCILHREQIKTQIQQLFKD